MVEHWQIQHQAGFFQLAGEPDIGLAGLQVPGWMVVHQDDRAGVSLQGVLEDDFGIGHGSGYPADRYQGDSQHPVPAIQQQNHERFPVLQVVPDGKYQVEDITGTGNLWPVARADL